MSLKVAVVALLSPVIVAAAVAAGIAGTARSSEGSSILHQGLPIPLTQVEAVPPTWTNPLVDEVDALGNSRFSDIYGGFWYAHTGTIRFGVVASGTQILVGEFTADVRQYAAMLKGRCIALAKRAHKPVNGCSDVIASVAHSYKSLSALTLRVRETTALRKAGITLVGWGPDPKSNTVEVEVRGTERAARRILAKRFGPGWITVTEWKGGLPVAGPALSASPPQG